MSRVQDVVAQLSKKLLAMRGGSRSAACRARLSAPLRRVQLVVTPLVPGVAAYHSSVLIDSTEYTFSARGVTKAEGPMSHAALSAESTYIDYGAMPISRTAFEAALAPHFAPGSYDLLRKNCNSYADMALLVLCGQRLDSRYTQAESIGRAADRCLSLVQALTGGFYAPNPLADAFDPERLAQVLAAPRPAAGDAAAVAPASRPKPRPSSAHHRAAPRIVVEWW